MTKVSYKAGKINTKLTDFDGLKDYVVNNSVRNIPRVIKVRPSSENTLLGSF